MKVAGEREVLEREVAEIAEWFGQSRFSGITRLYSPWQVLQQRGTITQDYSVARVAAERFYRRLRELFESGKSVTTFGPYSPGQAVAMKRSGIEAIYLGGWATSAKGSVTENPGPDLASYPLSQVPDEAAVIVRALLTADKNQQYDRSKMSDEELASTQATDFSPFIIADADTGHGGEAHVANLVRRFVEIGVPGYHIEDQKPGTKKCGHQGGKVLVPQDEQNKRLNTARFQLDVMGVPGIIVARTDAEAATFLDRQGDERDQPFILGTTNSNVPSYKSAVLSILKRFYESGIEKINGHLLYSVSESAYQAAYDWLREMEMLDEIDSLIAQLKGATQLEIERTLDRISDEFFDLWQVEAGIKTYSEAVEDVLRFNMEDGMEFEMTPESWREFAKRASFEEARNKALDLGLDVEWDCELARTPEGYYQVRGSIDYAIAKSLAAAPFADILWMETKTADLADAKAFADSVHAVYPDKMLAYNLSPSFNWDTTGMSDEEMKQFPKELGKMGFVFNFITYGGHQIDGLAAEEFASALQDDGMLALARLQRKFRLLNSPYRKPQSLVGGNRLDGALMATSGRTAATKAMGKGSTQVQHTMQTEVPRKVLEDWLAIWKSTYNIERALRVELKPHTAGSDLLALRILDSGNQVVADMTFAVIQDRRKSNILSVRDQNTRLQEFRQKRLMTLMHLFLIHRYRIDSVHYVSPTEDNQKQTSGMQRMGIYEDSDFEIGQIIVAAVRRERIKELIDPESGEMAKLIRREN